MGSGGTAVKAEFKTTEQTGAGAQAIIAQTWPLELYRVLKAAKLGHMAYVPDAGHSTLIELMNADPDIACNVLTTEEEGVAIAAGACAWRSAQRTADAVERRRQLHQHAVTCRDHARFPLLMLITMRGEWAEFNPWQVPMGLATEAALDGHRRACHAGRDAGGPDRSGRRRQRFWPTRAISRSPS